MNSAGTPEIKPAVRRPNWQEALIVLAVVAGLVLTVLFSFRLYHSIFMLHHTRIPPGTSDVNLIQGWMNVPYIARAYRVPEPDLWKAIQVPEDKNRMRNLNTLDRLYAGGKPNVMIDRIKAAVQAIQAARPTPSPRSPTRTPAP
jgi:hypothetical protein